MKSIGSDAYEATLEYGADGIKKAQQLRKEIYFNFYRIFIFILFFVLAKQTLELTRDAGLLI